MKKILLILLLTGSFLFTKAQTTQDILKELSNTLATCITQITDGYVTETQITNKGASVDIKIPSSYTKDTLFPEVNSVFRKFGFEVIYPWSKFEDGGIRSAQSLDGIYFLFNYDEKNKVFSFIIPIPE